MKAKNSLKYKLLKLLICATVFPTLMVGIAAYWLADSALLEAAIASTESMNTHKADAFDQFAEELENILKDLTDSEATKAFLQLRKEQNSESFYLSAVRLSEKMDTLITQRGDAVNAVAFLWNDGSMPVVRNNGYALALQGDYRKNYFYQKMKQSDASVHYIALAEPSDGRPGLFLYKTIYHAAADENLGIAVIHVDEEYIRSFLQTGDHAPDSTFLLTGLGEIISMSGTLVEDKSLPMEEIYSFSAELERGNQTVSMGGSEYLISVAKSQRTGYKLLNITPLAIVKERARRIWFSVLAAVLAALLLSVVVSLLLFGYLKTPIVGLHTAMMRFRQGNLQERIQVRRRDELGELGTGFNKMAEQINQLIHEIEEEQKEKKEIAMRFLQAQISPHFLYNTLNSIKALTRMNRNTEACDMTTSLISLLRIASSGAEEIRLREEVRYVESYVMLMQLRRDADITLRTEVGEELMDCKVLKFTLQPFIENSIIHGNPEKALCISVRGQRAGKRVLRLEVQDNGSGFDTSLLRERPVQDEKQRFSRIGIHNVEERIRLYYGEAYEVSIQSEPGCGTKVAITLPFEK